MLPLVLLSGWLFLVRHTDVPEAPRPKPQPPAQLGPDDPDPGFVQPGNVAKVFSALEEAPAVTLVSIDPVDYRDRRRLGAVALTGAEKTNVVQALKKSVLEKPNSLEAGCFEPRHALEVEGGCTVTICFACAQLYADFPGQKTEKLLLTGSASKALDASLKRHHVPLATH